MKLKFICPITNENFERESMLEAEKYSSDHVKIDVQRIPYGTESIECSLDEALCAPGIIKLGVDSFAQGYDGIFVSCMGDPGVDALRELVDIPVVGPCRTAMLYAADIAHRFSVITVTDGVVPIIERIALDVGLDGKLVSCKAVNIPVLELTDTERLVDALTGLAFEAVEKYDAQAVILGCTGMVGVDRHLAQRLLEKGYDVPVLYPVSIAVRYLESLVTLELAQGRAAYPKSPDKKRSIWEKLNG
ncbi:MAG: aspartate/glutamate racemase family protein [Christensenella sp.]|nr:aspartate/glutamate racemase family protein [Christensenella sp.]